MRQPRVGFVTCVQLGLSCMEEIYAAGGRLTCVLTLHDAVAQRKSGRVYVDQFCAEHGVPLFKVRNINDADAVRVLEAQRLDWLFIIGWSQIAGPAVLSAVGRAVLGMHPTLLPQGRGRAAIPWAIIMDLRETGVTLFQLDERVDAGVIMLQERVPIGPDETASTLYARISDAHRTLMRAAWPRLVADELEGTPQDERAATYWPRRTPADGRLTPDMTVAEVHRLVRATTRPYPGAFRVDGDRILRIWVGQPARGPRPPAGAVRIPCRDGAYDATEFELEPLPQAGLEAALSTPGN